MSALGEGVPSTLLSLWRKVRQLLPVYAAIAESYRFAPPPFPDVSALDAKDDDVLQVAGWIEEIDGVSQPHHLRTVLQELDVCSSDLCVSTWLHHFISKPVRGSADRDKIDFLLSHYLRMNLPPSLQEGKPNYAAMKAVLEPVLGCCEGDLPEEAREVEELIGIAERCRSLAEFEQSGIIRRGRELKLRANELYFTPPFLLAFTHFNAVVRRECSRLMNSDLKFIGEAIDRLEQQGITHIDCTAANWSDREPLSELKKKWATWELANNDYSQDFFANLIAFRSSVEEALERCIELSMTSVSQELRSIRTLLLEMRTEIEELPRRLVEQTGRTPAEEPAPVPAKPVLVWQSNAKPAPAPAVEPAPENGPMNSRDVSAIQSFEQEFEVTPPALESDLRVPAEVPPAASPTPVMPSAVVPQAPPIPTIAATPQNTVFAPDVAPAPIAAAAAVLAPASASEPAKVDSHPVPANSSTAANPTGPQPDAADSNPAGASPNSDANGENPAIAAFDLEAGIERLQKSLSGKRPTAVSLAVAGTRILLTAAEAGMFALNDNRYAKGVQRAVMMRICLVSALENHNKTRDKSSISLLVPAGRTERNAIQDLIAECKTQKLAREEEILSATAKQLTAMLDRAERIAR